MTPFFTLHLNALRDALRRSAATPLNSLLPLLVIGIALALPSASWLVLDNIKEITGKLSEVRQISLFMSLDADRQDLDAIESKLRDAKIGKWRFVSREDALAHLKASAGMDEIIASLPRNPLPHAFVIESAGATPAAMERLAKTFAGWPKVDHVQLDSAWVRRLDAFLHIGRLSVNLLAALFAGALVTITFNTIRLQILGQAAEIEVARLIGATDAFVRRPFQYFGALQGALGGLFAAALVAAAGQLLADPVGELLTLYGSSFVPRGLSLTDTATLAAVGAALGWLGAQISVAIHLRRIS